MLQSHVDIDLLHHLLNIVLLYFDKLIWNIASQTHQVYISFNGKDSLSVL